MSLALYNTLTRRIEPFAPLAPPRVTLYTCGPTVWNYAHIGNFRTFLFEDLLRRHLEQSGYDVFHIMNLTDVDDRIIREAGAAGKTITQQTEPFATAFFEDSTFLRIKPAHVYPRATKSIQAMINLVERLLAKGVAYRADDGSVYFGIQRFATYGRLSQLDRREIKIGARVASDEYAKDNPSDFALWKRASAEDENVGAAWDAPFGRGRPGWHLECSAMSLEAIAPAQTLDIHCGGVDLIFPHHEDEIAQSEAATGQPFARHWMHGAFLNVKGTKMSKRFGNFLTARDLRDNGVDAGAFRHLVYSTHYRQELDFNDAALDAARQGSRRLRELRARLDRAGAGAGGTESERLAGLANAFVAQFTTALDDDLNSPRALAAVHDFARDVNRVLDAGDVPGPATERAWSRFERALDAHATIETQADPQVVWAEQLKTQREDAKRRRDFAEADRLRDELRRAGFEIRDSKDGTSSVQRAG